VVWCAACVGDESNRSELVCVVAFLFVGALVCVATVLYLGVVA
jgi:hypothetical protein